MRSILKKYMVRETQYNKIENNITFTNCETPLTHSNPEKEQRARKEWLSDAMMYVYSIQRRKTGDMIVWMGKYIGNMNIDIIIHL